MHRLADTSDHHSPRAAHSNHNNDDERIFTFADIYIHYDHPHNSVHKTFSIIRIKKHVDVSKASSKEILNGSLNMNSFCKYDI